MCIAGNLRVKDLAQDKFQCLQTGYRAHVGHSNNDVYLRYSL